MGPVNTQEMKEGGTCLTWWTEPLTGARCFQIRIGQRDFVRVMENLPREEIEAFTAVSEGKPIATQVALLSLILLRLQEMSNGEASYLERQELTA